MVLVRRQDKDGNGAADRAADLGRRGQPEHSSNARKRIQDASMFWYPIVFELHRFFIAVARTAVNNDRKESSAPDPLLWSSEAFFV